MNPRSLSLAIAIVACGCEAGELTDPPHRGRFLSGPVSPPPLHDLIRENASTLGISPEQQRRIQLLAEEARPALDGHHRDIGRAKERLRTLLREEQPDRAAVRSVIHNLGEAETRLREGEIGVMLDILEILQPGQREALGRLGRKANTLRRSRTPPRRPSPSPCRDEIDSPP